MSFRIKTIFILLTAMSLISGCGGQRGQYSTSQVNGYPTVIPNSWLSVIRGYKLNGGSFVEGVELPMFGLIVVAPPASTGSHSYDTVFETYETIIRESWGNAGAFELRWDRERDVIKLFGIEYQRGAGQLFLIIFNEKKENWNVRQVKPSDPNMTPESVVKDISLFLK